MKKILGLYNKDSKFILALEVIMTIQIVVFGCFFARDLVIDENAYCENHGYIRHYPGDISNVEN